MQVPKNSDTEALAMINASNYGLGSSVFSANQVGIINSDSQARIQESALPSVTFTLAVIYFLPHAALG